MKDQGDSSTIAQREEGQYMTGERTKIEEVNTTSAAHIVSVGFVETPRVEER